MAAVLQLTRMLGGRPEIAEIPGIRLRNYDGAGDIPRWLAIRNAAFAGQKVGVRRWDESDFAREFLEKGWWDPRGMWFAESAGPPRRAGVEDRQPDNYDAVGTISLAWRGTSPEAKPAIHWLVVSRGY